MSEIVEKFTVPVEIPTGTGPQRSRALFWPELRKLPRPEYLVKGVLDADSLAEIFGPTSCGKSFLGTDLGLHIAAGWDWNGHKVRQAGVLYVNAEGGAAIVNRLDAWQRHHGQSLDDLAFAVVIEPTSLLDAPGVAQVVADAGKVPDLGLIFIDTAARVMPGGDEGAETMSSLVDAIARIRAETHAGVCVVHHSGKDTSRGSRGSTVLPVTVRIPPGVADGGRIRLAGKGGESPGGGPPGDLHLTVRVRRHAFFRREGRDLHVTVPISVSEATLGAKIEVPTLEGRATVTIPEGTDGGRKLRLRGKGIADPKGGPTGDLIVTVQIRVPRGLDAEARAKFEELAKMDPPDLRKELER